MYNYGPGQSNPGGQFPDNSANSPYGSSQPQYPQQPQDPNAYPQQPQAPSAYPQQPQVSPTQPYDPAQGLSPGIPSSPQYGGGVAVPAHPTAPVTGPGPLDSTMYGGPSPLLAMPPKKKGPAVPILAAVSALLLIGLVAFMVLFFNAKGDLTDARATVGDNEEKIDDLEGDKKAAEDTADKSSECVKLVEDMFDELNAAPDAAELNRILDEMEDACKSS